MNSVRRFACFNSPNIESEKDVKGEYDEQDPGCDKDDLKGNASEIGTNATDKEADATPDESSSQSHRFLVYAIHGA